MDEEINKLKLVLRSLVVSSSSKVDVRTLMKDYHNMVGSRLPIAKFGYKEPISFLKERCSDSFLLLGPAANPTLQLITPETLEHIDKFVQRQRKSAIVKLKGKRTSIAETIVKPPEANLISKSFISQKQKERKSVLENKDVIKQNIVNGNVKNIIPVNNSSQNYSPKQDDDQLPNGNDNHIEENKCSQSVLNNFLKKRTALYSCSQSVSDSGEKEDNDSGRLTSSSSSSSKKMQLEELKKEIILIIQDYPEGVWCTDLLRLYRERYKRELNFSRFGFTSVLSLACALPAVRAARQPGGDWLLSDAAAPAPAPRAPPPPLPRAPPRAPVDAEDALPGVEYDEDVFPADCLHYLEGVPAAPVQEAPGDMVEVVVAEVYSPSHFWLQRLGPEHNLAMERVMDEMNEYYKRGEGRARSLAPGAVRVGHYCSSCYEGDWHRSIIVQLLDSDTVKVRHVDYGTVERCGVAGLKPLRREWGALPAQARRARLAAARPAGRRWPRAAALAFLRLVQARRLVANVVAVDAARAELEVLLIDTAAPDDRCLAAELVRAGHALPRDDPALHTAECYLFPSFPALEAGDTPSLAELLALQQGGLAPDCVPAFRRHVPPLLPTDDDSDASTAPSAPSSTPPSSPSTHSSPDVTDTLLSHNTEAAEHLPPRPSISPSLSHAPPLPKSEHRFTPRCNPPPRHKLNCPPTYPPSPVFSPPIPHFGYVPPPAPLFLPNTMEPSRPFMYVSQGPMTYGTEGASRGVALSAADCEAFALLSRVDPAAAQRFMLEAISRAATLPAPHAMPHYVPHPMPHAMPYPVPHPVPPMPHPAPRPASSLNPNAVEFKMVTAETQTDSPSLAGLPPRGAMRPPPGFEN